MRWICGFFAAALAVSPALAQPAGPATPIGAPTVAAFLKGCATDANGCQLAVGAALLDKIDVAAGAAQVCPPTGSDIGRPVADWLRQRPQLANQPAEDAIFTALTVLYPCGKPTAAD